MANDDTEIKKYKFQKIKYKHKSPILINYININKMVVSNKVSFGKKDFKCSISYKDA